MSYTITEKEHNEIDGYLIEDNTFKFKLQVSSYVHVSRIAISHIINNSHAYNLFKSTLIDRLKYLSSLKQDIIHFVVHTDWIKIYYASGGYHILLNNGSVVESDFRNIVVANKRVQFLQDVILDPLSIIERKLNHTIVFARFDYNVRISFYTLRKNLRKYKLVQIVKISYDIQRKCFILTLDCRSCVVIYNYIVVANLRDIELISTLGPYLFLIITKSYCLQREIKRGKYLKISNKNRKR
jgi:hypothetical protein